MPLFFLSALLSFVFLSPSAAFASENGHAVYENMHLGWHWAGLLCIGIFIFSYIAVVFEEYTHLRKSKPAMLGAGLIWVVIAIVAPQYNVDHEVLRKAIFTGLDEYASLMLFLLAAMTYISALENRQVFAVLRSRLVQAGLSLRQLFWATGVFAFLLSPVADNMTTALVLGAVVIAVGGRDKTFIALACINIVSAANAGGAFSPFGDITTLMVWQAQKADFFEFFELFLPALVNFLVPALIMSFFIATDKPEALKKVAELKTGAKPIIALGILTIVMAVSFEQFLGLPPFVGMMTGLSLLMITAWAIRHTSSKEDRHFDILDNVAAAEWDTLLFFFGVIFSVSGLGFLGYLELASQSLYGTYGASITNVALGFISALVDNIPVMFAVLTMNPEMGHFQWLLVTLTTGIGGSLLSVGSAAGVALMGVARGNYTFFSHLKWTPVLFLGYICAVAVHFLVNGNGVFFQP